jgi:hypothetical protein
MNRAQDLRGPQVQGIRRICVSMRRICVSMRRICVSMRRICVSRAWKCNSDSDLHRIFRLRNLLEQGLEVSGLLWARSRSCCCQLVSPQRGLKGHPLCRCCSLSRLGVARTRRECKERDKGLFFARHFEYVGSYDCLTDETQGHRSGFARRAQWCDTAQTEHPERAEIRLSCVQLTEKLTTANRTTRISVSSFAISKLQRNSYLTTQRGVEEVKICTHAFNAATPGSGRNSVACQSDARDAERAAGTNRGRTRFPPRSIGSWKLRCTRLSGCDRRDGNQDFRVRGVLNEHP